jgi:hypothetical protein
MILEKSARDGKSTKARLLKTGDTHETIVNRVVY